MRMSARILFPEGMVVDYTNYGGRAGIWVPLLTPTLPGTNSFNLIWQDIDHNNKKAYVELLKNMK